MERVASAALSNCPAVDQPRAAEGCAALTRRRPLCSYFLSL
jgi:hypothetical protein